MTVKRVFLLGLVFACLEVSSGRAVAQNLVYGRTMDVRGPKCKPGEVLVRFRPGVPGRAKAAAHAAVRAQVLRNYRIVPGLQHVRLPKGMSVEEAVARYQRDLNVLHAHPNYIVKEYDIPDDPQFALQWGLNNTGQTGGTPDADVDAPEA